MHTLSSIFRTILNVMHVYMSDILKTEMRDLSLVEAILLSRWTEHAPGGRTMLQPVEVTHF